MFQDGLINETQRDTLKGKWPYIDILEMVFDEDTLLLSFFDRYALPDEQEDLKKDVLKYIGAGTA